MVSCGSAMCGMYISLSFSCSSLLWMPFISEILGLISLSNPFYRCENWAQRKWNHHKHLGDRSRTQHEDVTIRRIPLSTVDSKWEKLPNILFALALKTCRKKTNCLCSSFPGYSLLTQPLASHRILFISKPEMSKSTGSMFCRSFHTLKDSTHSL